MLLPRCANSATLSWLPMVLRYTAPSLVPEGSPGSCRLKATEQQKKQKTPDLVTKRHATINSEHTDRRGVSPMSSHMRSIAVRQKKKKISTKGKEGGGWLAGLESQRRARQLFGPRERKKPQSLKASKPQRLATPRAKAAAASLSPAACPSISTVSHSFPPSILHSVSPADACLPACGGRDDHSIYGLTDRLAWWTSVRLRCRGPCSMFHVPWASINTHVRTQTHTYTHIHTHTFLPFPSLSPLPMPLASRPSQSPSYRSLPPFWRVHPTGQCKPRYRNG